MTSARRRRKCRKKSLAPPAGKQGAARNASDMLYEWLGPDAIFGLRAGRHLATILSAYQRIDVYRSSRLGAFYQLDGHFMASEWDECFYHESMVHPAALAHPGPRQALVIGGGDGGSAKELLKYPSTERVVVAELDAAVVAMARRYLPGIHQGAFDHPKLDLQIGDARDYIGRANARGERFDIVVFDLTAADGTAGPLHGAAFFAEIRHVLAPDGIVALQLGAPWFQPNLVRRIMRDLVDNFRYVCPMTLAIPLYGSLWGLATASDTLAPAGLGVAEIQARLDERGLGALRYYNAAVHAALFALPGVVRDCFYRP